MGEAPAAGASTRHPPVLRRDLQVRAAWQPVASVGAVHHTAMYWAHAVGLLVGVLIAVSAQNILLSARALSTGTLRCSLDNGTFALPRLEELGHLSAVAESIGASACHLIEQRPALQSAAGRRRLSEDRWTDEVDAALTGHLRTIRKMLRAEQPALTTAQGRRGWTPWVKLALWLDNAATQSDAFELRALSAAIMDAHLWTHIAVYEAVNVTFTRVADVRQSTRSTLPGAESFVRTVLGYYIAGRAADGSEAFRRMLLFQDNQGRRPFADFYDHMDPRRMSKYPIPGLRVLTWPDPHEMLPDGVGEALVNEYGRIAEEAAVVDGRGLLAGDAYPGISANNQWSKLVLYSAGTGWDKQGCEWMPTACSLIQGKMRTESEPLQSWYKGNRFPANVRRTERTSERMPL